MCYQHVLITKKDSYGQIEIHFLVLVAEEQKRRWGLPLDRQ